MTDSSPLMIIHFPGESGDPGLIAISLIHNEMQGWIHPLNVYGQSLHRKQKRAKGNELIYLQQAPKAIARLSGLWSN